MVITSILGRVSAVGAIVCALVSPHIASALDDQATTPALYRVAPPPSWVQPVTPEYAAAVPEGGLRDGMYFLLYDTQVNVLPRGEEHYVHMAIRADNAAAVESASQRDFVVDPQSEQLVFHFIRTVRAGKAYEQLGRARITALAQETQLERRVYNGRYNVNVLLDDVRVGDVIEYAYTLRFVSPSFPTHFASSFDFGWADPVRWQRLRVRHPSSRPVRHRVHNADVKPRVVERGGISELLFEWRDLRAIPSESDTPSWYVPWPYVEFTDRADWSEVVREAAALYVTPTRPDADVERAIQSVRAAGGGPEEQALRALQLVQEDVRYTSISIGAGSHRPSDPGTVLRRRFGDCKDKSLLLVTMLRALGLEAEPALVHSTRGHKLPDVLPTPFAFDHVIVRTTIGGRTYWLDGTRAKETLPLVSLQSPSFEHGLVLASDTKSLAPIPSPARDSQRREVHVRLDASAGLETPATLTVRTRYHGAAADAMRHDFARTHMSQREKDYLDYYAKLYPGTQSAGPIVVKDDAGGHVFEVRESYRLESAFTPDGEGKLELVLRADELDSYAESLGNGDRRAPIGVSYPVSVTQSFLVLLPDEWSVRPEVVEVDNPAFRYRSDVKYADRKLELRYDYDALSDHVKPGDIAQYLRDRERMNQDLGLTLTHDADVAPGLASFAIAPLPLAVLLGAFALGAWIAIRKVYRWDPLPPPPPSTYFSGLGGWLILPMLHMCIIPIVLLVLLGSLSMFAEANVWRGLAEMVEPGMGESAQYMLLVLLGVTACLFPVSVAGTVLFFRKRTSAPALYISIAWATVGLGVLVGYLLIEAGLDTETPKAKFFTETVRDTLGTLIWTLYMLRSQRVKATFVNRLPFAAAEAPGEGFLTQSSGAPAPGG